MSALAFKHSVALANQKATEILMKTIIDLYPEVFDHEKNLIKKQEK